MINDKKIIEVIRENLSEEKIKEIEITTEMEFIRDLGYDSISFMGLFLELEEEFKISIISNEKNYLFFSIITVGDLIDALLEVM